MNEEGMKINEKHEVEDARGSEALGTVVSSATKGRRTSRLLSVCGGREGW